MAYGIVYKITNKLNEMLYVGKTTRPLEVRFNEHAKADSYIGNAIRKYGEENFSREVIEECETPEQLDKREIYFIAKFDCKYPNGYNQTDGGDSGWKHTPESRARMGKANSGEKHYLFGKHHSAETIEKMKLAQLGEKNPNFGKKFSAEHCAKIGAASKGRKHSKETREKIGDAERGEKNHNFGKPRLAETCTKISVANRGETPYKNLSDAITERQLSYTALGKLMGLSQASISCKMSGKRNFTENDKNKLVEIFNLPAEYLMARS